MAEPEKETPVNVTDITTELDSLATQEKELMIAKNLAIDKAMRSDNPSDILKAMDAVKITTNEGSEDRKAFYEDPLSYHNQFGYKSAPNSMTYDTLFSMSRSPIVNAIIKKRKNQVATFSSPQKDRFSTGFIIRKKGHFIEKTKELSNTDRKRIDMLTEFILECGDDHSWSRDDFDTFLRKFIDDSLTYDQATFEIIRTKGGGLHEFVIPDSGTIRIADSYHDSDYRGEKKPIAGYYPSYVQMWDGQIKAEFYPWELCFATRNPTSRIYSNGYGRSELEDLVATVTSMLWSDQYNRNFFKVGASPKGILRVKGGTNNVRLQEFRQHWKAMVAGVENSWRTPVIDSESMEWIDLQTKNRDMEFGKWQEYLIKLSCALYTISPQEIGFPTGAQTASGGQSFQSNNEQSLKYSLDHGLKPLLKFAQAKINKYLVSQIFPDLVFEFVGVDAESEEEYRKRILDEVQYYKTVDEVRAYDNNEPLPDGAGEIIMNPTYTADRQQKAMAEQQGAEGEEGAPEGFDGEEGEEPPTAENQEAFDEAGIENPFAKSFHDMVDALEKGEI